jgi:integrase
MEEIMSVRRENRKTKAGTRGVWVVDVVAIQPDGSEVRVKKQSTRWAKQDALTYERQLLRSISSGEYSKRKEEEAVPTLANFAEEFIEGYAKVHNKPSEVVSKQGNLDRYILPALAEKYLNEINVRDIEKLKGRLLAKGLKPKTVNNALATLGKLLRYAEEIEIIGKVPRIRLLKTPPPEFDFLSFEEAEKLLAAATYNPEWHAMIFFALRTGVRYGELCELRWSDVDLNAGRVVIRRSFCRGHVTTPKGGRQREIPLSPQTADLLHKQRHLKGELVFCKDDGGYHIHRRADVAIKRCCRYAKLRSIGWHVLRHSFASHLVMRGVPLKSIQELLGHSTMEMTMRYAHLSPEVNRDAVATLDEASMDKKVTAT